MIEWPRTQSNTCFFVKEMDESPVKQEILRLETLISPLKAQKANFEKWGHVAKIVKATGVAFLVSSVAIAAIFFTAPVSVPILVGGACAIATLKLLYCLDEGFHPDVEASLVGFGPIVAGVSMPFVSPTLARIVYSAEAANIAGIACGLITGVGCAVFAAGALGEKYCEKKISNLDLQLKKLQSKLQVELDQGTELKVLGKSAKLKS